MRASFGHFRARKTALAGEIAIFCFKPHGIFLRGKLVKERPARPQPENYCALWTGYNFSKADRVGDPYVEPLLSAPRRELSTSTSPIWAVDRPIYWHEVACVSPAHMVA